MTLVLASTSPYRRELLGRLDIPFSVDAPVFDERLFDDRFAELSDEEFALELALGKAESLVSRHGDAWILAADQIAVIQPDPEEPEGNVSRRLLHKPETKERAVEQLMSLAGRRHALTTGVVLLDGRTGVALQAWDRQTITMRAFSREEAEAYVRRYEPLDCVGSYRVEDAGIKLMESIEGGDFTSIMGLPLLTVSALLRRAGLLPV